MVSGEPDFTKRMKGMMDLWWIKSVLLQDPTIAACLPISIENPALAYNSWTDRFKVDIEAMTVGTIVTDISDDWTRQLGLVDLSRYAGAAVGHGNPLISRLTDGSSFIDPRDISDRAARLLGKIYGDQGVLTQRPTSLDLYVQLRHEAAEIDPRAIRALTSSDILTIVQATAANLNATVTQAAKDRTISSMDATATPYQISKTWAAAGDYTVRTPAGGKAIRLKFISLELSADVTLGYKFAAGGDLHYLRTTKGPYVSNLMGCNNQGAADAALILNSDGAATAKGYVLLSEV